MKISEIFYSIQGEGFLAGTPSIFIRVADCPLNCRWCDTRYAFEEADAKDYSIEQIIKKIQQWDCHHVVITGGEPMINPDLSRRTELPNLVQAVKELNKYITIETIGIAFIPEMPCDLMSISPKLSNSIPNDSDTATFHDQARLDLAILRVLLDEYDYQLKFVVDSKDDLSEILETIQKVGNVDSKRVMLMPQAKTRQEFIQKAPMVAELCKKTGYTFSPRLQIVLWNTSRGT
ncbi:MAG: 7-carboxy-7-deazaguanine synthase QueE [Planctomycetota bacterium]|jgi:7-carboxy-7-deazaguanine synthase